MRAPSEFVRSVNPIQTRGQIDYAYEYAQHITVKPLIQRYLPTYLHSSPRRLAGEKKK